MNITFLGTSKYCLPVLDALKPQLKFVVVMPDKPVGRKQILTPCATKTWSIENNIPYDVSLRADAKQSIDLALVADYGKIIKKEIYTKPRLGTFNIHFSKLPDLRGPSPVQSTLLRGDTTAWVTIFKIDESMDTGPILWQKEYPIFPNDTAQTLYTRLFIEVAKELVLIISQIENSKLTPQSGTPTYCKFLTKQDGFVNLDDPNIYNKYRAYSPWPGIWTIKNNKRMKILKCHLENNKLVLDQIQFEGKNPQDC